MMHFKLFIGFSFLFLSSSLIAQTKPGDIDPNAKVLAVDKLYLFSDGVARVQKGNSYALIDASGNFVVPFNKWSILKDSKSGVLVVSDNKGFGLINTKGR